MVATVRVSVMLAAVFLFVGCGIDRSSSNTKNPISFATELKRLGATGALLTGEAVHLDGDNNDDPYTSAIKILSYKLPLHSVVITSEDGANNGTIYECEGTTDEECLVDLMAEPDTNILGDRRVEMSLVPDRYTSVSLTFCTGDKVATSAPTVPAALAAQFDIGGVTYYTKSDGTVSSTGPAQETTISMHGCLSTAFILHPLVVEDEGVTDERQMDSEDVENPKPNASVNFKMFYSLDSQFYAYRTVAVPGPNGFGELMAGCIGSLPVANEYEYRLCSSYPTVSGTIDAGKPYLERYRINDSATVGLFLSGEDFLFGAYVRPYFTEGLQNTMRSNEGLPPGGNVAYLRQNAGGKVALKTYGDTFVMEALERKTHSGTMSIFNRTIDYSSVKVSE